MHPHPDQRHVMVIYRKHILAAKRKFGTARCLVHYRGFIDDYLAAKRVVVTQLASSPDPGILSPS
jgi:hypothetical protein